MIKDLVSIVIPTHKRPELLKKAIESALAQTYSMTEIIVVDDNSGDNTEQVIKDLNNKNIRYFRNDSSLGGAGTRNVGIEKSNGEFVAFLDDDDIWYKDKLELQVNKINENESNILCTCGLQVVYVAEGLKYFNFPKLNEVTFKKMLLNNKVGITSTVMVRRKALDQSGYFDHSLPAREEYELWIRLSRFGNFVSVNKPLLDYYIHPSRQQISASIDKFITANKLIQKKYELEFNKMSIGELKQLKADNYFQYSTIAINNKKNLLALKYICRSILKKLTPDKVIIMISYLLGFRAYILLKQFYGKKLLKRNNE
ncbi:MAG: glycosyltransferase [Candidatus Delongbacteria bacterium]|nr:glycosyltransferase [Candidatus Delongbacteria bacterium]